MKKVLIILFLVLFAAPLLAQAATPCTINRTADKVDVKPSDLPLCVNQIYIWSLGVASLLALLMIVIGGYYYMTSSGNAEQASKGTEMIWSSVIGLALLFGAYLLLSTINPDLVNFENFNKTFNDFNTQSQQPPATQPPATQPPSTGGVRQ